MKPTTLLLILAGLGVAAPSLAVEGNAKNGSLKNSMCIGCHGIEGYQAVFPTVYRVPQLGGQQPVYIVNALKAYKSGERNHPTMRAVAASLTEQDMADLAAYYATK